MKKEFFEDLANFEEAVRKYADWMKADEVGLRSWWEGAKDLYRKVTEAKYELDQWNL